MTSCHCPPLNNRFLRPLLIFVAAIITKSILVEAYSCVDPTSEYVNEVVRDQETIVCLYVGPAGNWNSDSFPYKRFTFQPTADEFSSYRIPNSYQSIVNGRPFASGLDGGLHVFAASQTSLSFLRRYYDEETQEVFPHLTAVIDVKNGIVRGIVWDEACVFCDKAKCLENTYNFAGELADGISQPTKGCPVPKSECDEIHKSGGSDCDLKLHVVWTGTDANDKVLFSSDSRFSAFPPNRIQEFVRSKVDTVKKGVSDTVSDAENIVDKVPGVDLKGNDEDEG